jgi:hypothetical protein
MNAVARGCLAGALVFCLSGSADAQESKSAALAKQLTAALDSAKLDSVAAKDPSAPDLFVAALYFPGAELLVVSAKYSAPTLLVDRIGKKEYREVYIDLNSASVPESKVFVEDLGADGLKAKHDENQPFDSYEAAGKRMAFDGEWKKQKLTEQDYLKAFSAADEKYSQMLRTLLAQLKQTS